MPCDGTSRSACDATPQGVRTVLFLGRDSPPSGGFAARGRIRCSRRARSGLRPPLAASCAVTTLPQVSVDRGVTHVALPVTDLDASLEFYAQFAAMQVVHRRTDASSGTSVAWISDLTRPFVLVLIEVATIDSRLGGVYCHVGLGVESRAAVDAACARATEQGRTVLGPVDSGPPVGYWAYVLDPDGHNLEISYGQEVGLTVEHAERAQA